MPGPWEKYGGASAAPTAAPDPIIKPVDQFRVRDQQLQEEAAARARADQELQVGKTQFDQSTKVATTGFDQADKLRSAFNALPDVKEYRQAIKAYSTALKSAPNPAGDLNLIYAFAKIMDPNSVVREGEAAAVAEGDTLAGQYIARLKKELAGDGTFRPEYRNQLRKELQTRVAELNRSYENQRTQYQGFAEKFGIDPAGVLGEHDGKLFYDDVFNYWKSQGAQFVEGDAPGMVDPRGAPTVDGNGSGWSQIGAGVGDIVEGGINNTVGLLANPVNTAIGRGLGYEGYTADMGQSARDALGLPEGDPTISAINQGAAGVGAMGQVARGAIGAARSAPVRNALAQFADQPLSNMTGGAVSAGLSEGARQQGYGPGVQAGAALVGGAGGYGAGRAVNAFSNPRTPTALGRAADDMGVTLMPADAGGAGTRMASGAVGRTLGGVPMAEGAERAVGSLGAARDRVAGNVGRVTDTQGAGQAAKRGAKDFISKSEERGGELYEKISIPPKTQAETSNTKTALAELTKGLESNPKLSKLWTENPRLKATLDALEKGGLSWEDLKRLRSIVGEIAGGPSLASDGHTNKAMKAFYGALSKDMEATATASGPRALSEFRRANQYWRGREKRIDTVLSSILGNDLNKSDEAAFAQINRWAQTGSGDFKAVAQAIRSMPAEEANTVRATLLARMGQAKKGAQDERGEVFSPAEFITQWSGLDERAKKMLFPNGDQRQDIEKLAMIASNMKQAGKYTNFSNTALGVNLTLHSAGLAGGPMGILASLGSAGLEFAAGKLLASPKFARWLASVPAKPSGGAQRHLTEALSSVAAKDPTIKAEVIQLSDYLKRSVEASPRRAAAEEEDD